MINHTNTYSYLFLSGLDRSGKLFEDCVGKLIAHDPTWTRERIFNAIDILHYDVFLCTGAENSFEMVGAIAFNPDSNVMRAFLLYVTPKFRGRDVAPLMGSEFLIWVAKSGYKNAQLGLGNNHKVAVLLRLLNHNKDLLHEYASHIEITPETGSVFFEPI